MMKVATLIFITMATLQVNPQDTSKIKNVIAKQILYSIKYSRGENYDSTKSIYKQDLSAHGIYMQKLFDEGKLILAGPFIDDSGGQVIIQAGSEEEAMSIIQNDPAVLKHIFKGELHSWHISLRNTEQEIFSLKTKN